MKSLLIILFLTFFSFASDVMADGPSKASTENGAKTAPSNGSLIDQIKARQRELTTLMQGTTARYGREFLEKSRAALQRAQELAEAGQGKAANRVATLSDLLVQRAKAVTAEQEAIEKSAIKRAELKKLQERTEELLKGKGN